MRKSVNSIGLAARRLAFAPSRPAVHHIAPSIHFSSDVARYFHSSTASLSSSSSSSKEEVDFGFRNVNRGEKENMVKEVFNSVASKYDIMNDLMSAGIHRLWKDELIDMLHFSAAAKADPTFVPRHLDVAGGTGDIAFRSIKEMSKNYKTQMKIIMDNMSSKNSNSNSNSDNNINNSNSNSKSDPSNRQIVVCDINREMLAVGEQRAPSVIGDLSKLVGFVEGNAERLPFPDESFDIYTIAFGLRNVTDKDAALRDAYRVLRKNGRLLVLEFSHIPNPLLQFAYDQYSFNVIPEIGRVVANDRDSYQYLVESIRKFPKQDELLGMMKNANFKCCTYRNLTVGVVAIHSGYKV